MSGSDRATPTDGGPPLALKVFCYAMMLSAGAINGIMLSLAIPAAAPYGFAGFAVAAALGMVAGIWPARWLARKIHDGLSDGT